MGSKFFHQKVSPHANPTGNLNLESRAIGSSAYGARSAGGGAAKDLGAASAFGKGALKPTMKDAAANAPGPKRT